MINVKFHKISLPLTEGPGNSRGEGEGGCFLELHKREKTKTKKTKAAQSLNILIKITKLVEDREQGWHNPILIKLLKTS